MTYLTDTQRVFDRFSARRLLLVVNRFAFYQRRTWEIAFAAALGLLFLSWLLQFLFSLYTGSELPSGFGDGGGALSLYVLGGCILTSVLFTELHSPSTAFQLLTLPVSRLELLLAAWVTGALGYTVAAFLSLFLLSIFTGLASALSLQSWGRFDFFNPFTDDVGNVVAEYLLLQSAFLLGAIYFRGKNFLKTVLSVILVFVVIGLLAGLAVYFLSLVINPEQLIRWIEQTVEPLVPGLSGGFTRNLGWGLGIVLILGFAYRQLGKRQVS